MCSTDDITPNMEKCIVGPQNMERILMSVFSIQIHSFSCLLTGAMSCEKCLGPVKDILGVIFDGEQKAMWLEDDNRAAWLDSPCDNVSRAARNERLRHTTTTAAR